MVSVADSNTEWVRGEWFLTGHLLDVVAVVVEVVFEKQLFGDPNQRLEEVGLSHRWAPRWRKKGKWSCSEGPGMGWNEKAFCRIPSGSLKPVLKVTGIAIC